MKLTAFLRNNSFVLLLLCGFVLVDVALSIWDPMSTSLRFYKNDFTKTILHHEGRTSGTVFYGNSAVTGAYMEDKAQHPLVEMGLSYGKLTDLQQIMEQGRYTFTDRLVIGIDAHTMLDALPTDDTYPWFKPWYEPYIYYYRDYFRDTGRKWLLGAAKGQLLAYEPAWTDKLLYYGHKPPEDLRKDWERYEKLFNWMTVEQDMKDNFTALEWVLSRTKATGLPVSIVLMPINPDPAYPQPAYIGPLHDKVMEIAKAHGIPALDLMHKYAASDFHDLVHLNREEGAPKLTKEVDQWLQTSASSSK
ncbi:hypothetical protein [Paenibacillus sp. y28]|uniref:hypothetical protein n=1 Tax=Paenibacillus sp. y28 TaxID=3129110 RepID=UPI00301748AA